MIFFCKFALNLEKKNLTKKKQISRQPCLAGTCLCQFLLSSSDELELVQQKTKLYLEGGNCFALHFGKARRRAGCDACCTLLMSPIWGAPREMCSKMDIVIRYRFQEVPSKEGGEGFEVVFSGA